MNIIKIEGKRQTGKSTLLAHYIDDALKMGKKVLLTDKSLYGCRLAAEKAKEYDRNKPQPNFKVATSHPMGESMYYDILAIEESDVNNWQKYVDIYTPNLAPEFTIVITGVLED